MNKFRVGQKVRCINELSEVLVGEIVRIKTTIFGGQIGYYDSLDKEQMIFPEHFQLISVMKEWAWESVLKDGSKIIYASKESVKTLICECKHMGIEVDIIRMTGVLLNKKNENIEEWAISIVNNCLDFEGSSQRSKNDIYI